MAALANRLAPAGEAEDVLQDALADAWRKRSQFDASRGTARSWLLAIVADRSYKSRRRVRRTTVLADVSGESASVDDLDLQAALRELAPRQRLAVELHYYLGFPVAEVATLMRLRGGDGQVDAVRRARPAAAPARIRRGRGMTIEERITRDAAQWREHHTAPPFDVSLDRALAAPSRRHRAWLAVAAAVVLIAAIATFAATRSAQHPMRPPGRRPLDGLRIRCEGWPRCKCQRSGTRRRTGVRRQPSTSR